MITIKYPVDRTENKERMEWLNMLSIRLTKQLERAKNKLSNGDITQKEYDQFISTKHAPRSECIQSAIQAIYDAIKDAKNGLDLYDADLDVANINNCFDDIV